MQGFRNSARSAPLDKAENGLGKAEQAVTPTALYKRSFSTRLHFVILVWNVNPCLHLCVDLSMSDRLMAQQ